MKGISIVIYGSEIDRRAKEIKYKGGEIISSFLNKFSHPMTEEKIKKISSWKFFE
jgi:hypothetical protein